MKDKVSLPEKDQDQSVADLLESTALQRVAMAELINAGAEEIKKASELDDITLEDLTKFQDSIENLLSSGIEMQKLFREDLQDLLENVDRSTDKDEVFQVEEEIEEEITDDNKRKLKKKVRKKKE